MPRCRLQESFPGESILCYGVPAGKHIGYLSLINCCWILFFCDSQVGNNKFPRRYMISTRIMSISQYYNRPPQLTSKKKRSLHTYKMYRQKGKTMV